jgi:MFS family permease
MSRFPFRRSMLPLILSSFVARVPKGMVPLATILLMNERTGSYLIAGTVAGLVALRDAITTPVQGRLVDRFGLARVVLPAVLVHVLGVALLLGASGHHGVAVAVLAAGLIGSGNPPISAGMKTIWPPLVGQDELPAAYTLESLVQQVVFLSGPLLIALITALGSPGIALALSAGLLATGALWFVFAVPRGAADQARSGHLRSGALRKASVRVLTGGTFQQGFAYGALPVGLTSFTTTRGTPDLVGVLLAALTVGGILGTFAPVPGAGKSRYVRLVSGFALALVPVAVTGGGFLPAAGPLVALFLVIAGLFLTPIAAACYVLLQQTTDTTNRTEAFAWLSTGQAAGSAAGAALAGLLVDRAGTFAALGMIPVAVALAVVVTHWWLD